VKKLTITNWNLPKTVNWYLADAWRAALNPDAITEAVTIGEQIIELLTQTIALVERACAGVNPIIENTHPRCKVILDGLYGQAHRLDPALARLRSAGKAVTS
jgi:hypothetical protein